MCRIVESFPKLTASIECAYVSQKEETKREVPSTELDCVLGIQEDDGNGPGLSEDEMQGEERIGIAVG